MPVLKRQPEPVAFTVPGETGASPASTSGLLQACANPQCRSGWLHLWRSRTGPVFEGGWSCSADCTRERVRFAVRRELESRGAAPVQHRHRIPLGLLMMEQGWISAGQLKDAVQAQKTAGSGRLGRWLIHTAGVGEDLVTRALSLQWSCPVLPLEFHDAGAMASVVPRVFIDALGVLPLRIAARKLLYLGFENRIDPVLALAVERMSGLRVECGLVAESQFRPAQKSMLETVFPPSELIEAASEPAAVHVLAQVVERHKPQKSRLVRAHDFLWLRLWTGKGGDGCEALRDVLCTVGYL